MRVKCFASICGLLASILLNAQSPYSFTYSSEAYQNITNATQISDSGTWQVNDVIIPLGFNFKLFDHTGNFVNFFAYSPVFDLAQNSDEISAADLTCTNRHNLNAAEYSHVYYKTEGVAGSKVCKVEINNFGVPPNANDFINLQFWFYETSNAIEFRYGPSNFTNINTVFPNGGPRPDLWYTGPNPNYYGCSLTGNPGSPIFHQTPDAGYLSAFPASGTVYRFSWVPDAINETEQGIALKVYPNPATDKIFITAEEPIEAVEVYNLLGEKVREQRVEGKSSVMDVAELPKGVYLVRVVGRNWERSRRW